MYCDNHATLLKMCSDFGSAARPPPPGRAMKNPIIERHVGLSIQRTSCVEADPGLPHVIWPQIGRSFAFNHTCCVLMANGKTGYGNQFGSVPTFELFITGEFVFFIQAPTIVGNKKTEKASSNLRVGISLDYYVSYTGEFTGQYICVCLEDVGGGESLHRDVDKHHFKLKLHLWKWPSAAAGDTANLPIQVQVLRIELHHVRFGTHRNHGRTTSSDVRPNVPTYPPS